MKGRGIVQQLLAASDSERSCLGTCEARCFLGAEGKNEKEKEYKKTEKE